MSGSLDGKRAVVTGAAAGIGRAVAQRFLDEGADVALIDLDPATVDRVAGEINPAGPNRAIGIAADVSSEPQLDAALRRSREELGGIDVLCNNAGIQGQIAPLVETETEQFDRLLGINVRGVFLGMKLALPEMIERGSGAIINTASIAAHRGWPASVGYFAAKHAVLGMTRAAAAEVSPLGVRVNAVCPGFVDTALMQRFADTVMPDDAEAFRSDVTSQIPAGRYGRPDEIAEVFVFLASERSSFVYGSDWVVDGGTLATRGAY